MQKSEMIKEMERTEGTLFVTKAGFAKWFGIKDPHYAAKYLHGVEAIDGKYYFIPEVAEILKERCRA